MSCPKINLPRRIHGFNFPSQAGPDHLDIKVSPSVVFFDIVSTAFYTVFSVESYLLHLASIGIAWSHLAFRLWMDR